MKFSRVIFGTIVFVVVNFLISSLVFPPSQVYSQSDPTPMIIDTDMAMDDWMGMLYLLQRTDIEIQAITIVGTGEAHCDPGIRNTMNLLALAGKPDIPVACGRETPLQGSNTFPQEWRDWVDSMAMMALPENPNTPVDLSAVELLEETISASEQPITILTLGPLTNLAELLTANPALIEQIEMVYTMGGALEVDGNLQGGMETDNSSAEWNFYVDPLADAQVIESGVPITLIPLDVTNQAPLTREFFKRLGDDKTTPGAEFVYDVLSQIIAYPGWYFWDQLAAVVATDESVVTIQDYPIRIITEAGDEQGRCVLDEEGHLVRVAVGIDNTRFEEIYLDGLNGRMQ